ncbi:MAG: PIN domain-containing protein [Chloroflexota bacterium]
MRRRKGKPTETDIPLDEAGAPEATASLDVVPSPQPTQPERRGRPISFEFVIRLLGGAAAGFGGFRLAEYLTATSSSGSGPSLLIQIAAASAMAAIGVLLTPYVTTRPFGWLRHRLQQAPAHELIAGLIGLLIGLILAALLAIPLSVLPSPFKELAVVVAGVVLVYLGVTTTVIRKRDLANMVTGWRTPLDRGENREKAALAARQGTAKILLDTSAIIDGRIADVTQTGFINGALVVPRFVLNELQHIADSPDALRRNRGRRGLDLLGRLQKEAQVPIEVTDVEPNAADVDSKLVRLAKQMGSAILTNDYNLNRVAALQGVRVLNINELANALKAVVLPGEEIPVRVIQEGKEFGQGVGYLDDGTMIVVENGRRYLGSQITVIVTRVLQTVAGRMIFGHPRE